MLRSVEYEDVKEALVIAKQELGEDSNLIARKSGTEPVIKLRVECPNIDLVKKWSAELKRLIEQYKK